MRIFPIPQIPYLYPLFIAFTLILYIALNRYLSLDFFRGLTIALMIVVNNPGTWEHVYAPLRHAEWHGCTPTDLVFPFFLFIVGVAVWFSFSKHNQNLTRELSIKILRRTLLIFLVGVLLNAYPFVGKDWTQFRIMGVLQRIAMAYGIGAFLCVLLPRMALLLVGGLILAAYWTLLHLFGWGDPYAVETNLVRIIDLKILTANHLYKGFGIPFDPEGLLGALSASVTVIMGYLTGSLIAEKGDNKGDLVYDMLWYGVTAASAGLLWSLAFPINKPLWTSSYVLYAGGLAMIFLAACIYLMDMRGWKAPVKPFLVFGSNPLFAFVLSGVLVKTMNLFKITDAEGNSRGLYYWIYKNIFFPIDAGKLGSLLFALAFTGFVWLICWVLYRRKIFIKI